MLKMNADNSAARFKTTSGNIDVTLTACKCSFNIVMRIPCRHILALRSRLKLSLFDITSCHIRWTKEFYLSGHRISTQTTQDWSSDILIKETRSSPITSSHQKYREASAIGQKIASCSSELGMREYSHVHCKKKELKQPKILG